MLDLTLSSAVCVPVWSLAVHACRMIQDDPVVRQWPLARAGCHEFRDFPQPENQTGDHMGGSQDRNRSEPEAGRYLKCTPQTSHRRSQETRTHLHSNLDFLIPALTHTLGPLRRRGDLACLGCATRLFASRASIHLAN